MIVDTNPLQQVILTTIIFSNWDFPKRNNTRAPGTSALIINKINTYLNFWQSKFPTTNCKHPADLTASMLYVLIQQLNPKSKNLMDMRTKMTFVSALPALHQKKKLSRAIPFPKRILLNYFIFRNCSLTWSIDQKNWGIEKIMPRATRCYIMTEWTRPILKYWNSSKNLYQGILC